MEIRNQINKIVQRLISLLNNLYKLEILVLKEAIWESIIVYWLIFFCRFCLADLYFGGVSTYFLLKTTTLYDFLLYLSARSIIFGFLSYILFILSRKKHLERHKRETLAWILPKNRSCWPTELGITSVAVLCTWLNAISFIHSILKYWSALLGAKETEDLLEAEGYTYCSQAEAQNLNFIL